ncbi:expressed unknown protein [Seminavis robusta]|uniref:Uncharacterized protein n=1 Tax=Seminavis robusta TaxID=568900 RepID=A0A9N8DG64_9STRA|nr:expressed unknown protein [Seminavis robusta]|eukprot:Sro142_g066140.1 n/a (205) ;mRNA; f:29094-29708
MVQKKVSFAVRPKLHMYYTEPSDTKRRRKRFKETVETEEWIKTYSILLEGCYRKPVQEKLDAFVILSDKDYIRGKECIICKDFAQERAELRLKVVQSVIAREMSLKIDTSKTLDDIADELCAVSQKHSCCARTFARHMGKADELAARVGEDNDTAMRLIYRLHGQSMKSLSATLAYVGHDYVVPGVCQFAHLCWRSGILCSGVV